MYKKGSIITITVSNQLNVGTDKMITKVQTISIIDKVVDNHLFCKHSIVSVNDAPFVSTKKKFKGYEGELIGSGVRLVTSDEFDIVIDTQIIPRNALINVQEEYYSANVG